MSHFFITRRQFLRGLAATGLLGISATCGYATLIEPFDYEITTIDVSIKDLAERFENFRITLLSDIHHSSLVSLDQVHRVMALAQGTKPDMFALAGDYTTARRRYIEPCAEALGSLRAPEGAWAVLGNHDHSNDPELTRAALRRRGISVLGNANTTLRRGPDSLQLAGIDDWSWAGSDWERAFHGVDLHQPAIMLSHQPRVWDLPETAGVSLILSGHTHGGQINLPLLGVPAMFFVNDIKYLSGLYEREDRRLYVTRGTGVIGLPVRIGARPEITVLTLRRAAPEQPARSKIR